MTASAIDRMIARRLWNGSTAGPTAGNPNRRMVAKGDTITVPGETPVTVAVHDASFRHDGDGPTTVSYLI